MSQYKQFLKTHLDLETLFSEETKTHLRDLMEHAFQLYFPENAASEFFTAFFTELYADFTLPEKTDSPFFQALLYHVFACNFPFEHVSSRERLFSYLIQILSLSNPSEAYSQLTFSQKMQAVAFCMHYYEEGSFYFLEEARKDPDFAHCIDSFYLGYIDTNACWQTFLKTPTKTALTTFLAEQEQNITSEFDRVFGLYGHQQTDSSDHFNAFTKTPSHYIEGIKKIKIVLPTKDKLLESMPYLISQARAICHFSSALFLDPQTIPITILDQSSDEIYAKNHAYIEKIVAEFKINVIHLDKQQIIDKAKKENALDLIVTDPPDTLGYAGARNAAFLLIDADDNTYIQMGDDDLYVMPQSLFSDALTAYTYRDEDVIKTGYIVGRDTLEVYATTDLNHLLQKPEQFVSQFSWNSNPHPHPIAGALMKRKICVNTPFGQEENHVIVKKYIFSDYRRPALHLAGWRYPDYPTPKNRYSGLAPFLKKMTRYVYELMTIRHLLDTANLDGNTALCWNKPPQSYTSFQMLLDRILETKKECQDAFYKNVHDNPLNSYFEKLKNLDIKKTISEFLEKVPHFKAFENELQEIAELYSFFQQEALEPKNRYFSFVVDKLTETIGEGGFFNAIENYCKHHHGIALALFSLKTKNSCGVGEFYDLLPLIDWCKDCHLDILQLLPINDSGFDPSPYSAHTAMGLHPIYLSLYALDHLDSSDQDAIKKMQSLNDSERVLYTRVLTEKLAFLRNYYQKHFAKIENESDYQSFIHDEAYWLDSYARYKVLKEKNSEKPWWEFADTESTSEEESFYKMCQFLLFSQMQTVKLEAEKKGVLIKGDIPILLNKDSSDVWQNQHLFCLETSVGAPPDMYNHEGQNWGFPAYNWQALEKEGYSWWLKRLKLSEKLYHLYRLDHIVGFYRIWAIRENGACFDPEEKETWLCQGEKILSLLTSHTSMQAIGEDLGSVPDEVRQNLQKLKIPGTKVMRWERNWQTDQAFIDPKQYQSCSMTTVSTHDSEPLGLWWKLHPDEASRFCTECNLSYSPDLDFEMRKKLLKLSHTTASLYHINLLTEYLALFPELSYQDDEKERINVPGTVSDTNWTIRLKASVETIVNHKGLQKVLDELI